jgi:hypothetical protein
MADEEPMARIGFYDPFSIYDEVKDRIQTKVHLTNLHWKESANDPLRSIPQLAVRFEEEKPKGFDNNSAGPLSQISELSLDDQIGKVVDFTSIPFVRLMFVTADGLDSYRSKVRPLMIEWKTSCVEKAHGPVDWYVVYTGDDSKAHAKVFEKLKLDFETDTDRRCFMMRTNFATTLEENEFWGQFSSKLKDSMLSIFTTRLQILSAELQTLINGGKLKNNIGVFLVIKEAVAAQFLTMSLYEKSLEQYDGLSSSINELREFFQHQEWSPENMNLVESFMSATRLFQKGRHEPSLFALRAYIFTRIFKIFEAFADSAPSLSLASIHNAEFLRRLRLFILETTKDFQDSAHSFQVQEWGYKVVDEVLSLDLCAGITNSENTETESPQLSERCGELLLLQRSKLLEVGQAFEFHINGILTNLSLSEVFSRDEISYGPLKTILESTESFEEYFVKLTEAAIGHFNVCDRPRSVDALSIDIALLDYQKEQYGKAAVVLSTCPSFYGSQGWELIGLTLLEAYIGCLENLDDDSPVFEEGGNMARSFQMLQSFVLVLTLAKQNADSVPKNLIAKAIDYIINNEVSQPLELNKFFTVTSSTYVTPLENDLYELAITITNQFNTSIELSDVKLTLETLEGDTIDFSIGKSTLESGATKMSLTTSSIQTGTFTLSTFTAKLGNIRLTHIFEGDEKTEIFIFDSPNSLSLDIATSSEVHLGAKPISVIISTAVQISSMTLKVWRDSHTFILKNGCKIKSESDHSLDNFTILQDSIKIEQLDGPGAYEVIIPYTTQENSKVSIMELYASLSYDVNGFRRRYTAKSSLDTSLSIGVSVQDIFKANHLYCKFSIGTSEPDHPIRVISADLEPNENYDVCTALKPTPLVAFGEQPVNYFFQISNKADLYPCDHDLLTLTVHYREIKHEVIQVWRAHLHEQLRASSLESYSILLDRCSEFIEFDYDQFILNKTVSVSISNTYHQKYFKSIPPEYRQRVYDIFSQSANATFQVDDDFPFKNRKLIIDVSIPSPEVIHTLEIKFHESMTHAVVGEELRATLSISSVVNCNRKKKEPNGKKQVQFDGEQTPLNKYMVEVLTNQDNWVINGKTRHVIELDRSHRGVFDFPDTELSLIPLRAGKILLPKVKVDNLNLGSKNEALMEIEYKNENETIFVVSEGL